MAKLLSASGLWLCMSIWLAAAGVLPGSDAAGRAQAGAKLAPVRSLPFKERVLPDRFPDKPSLPPEWTIPIESLGFGAPGPIYLGEQNALASLDFMGEDRLLFTFRVPGLLRRDAGSSEERQIRAVVLALPTGNVENEALWTVHDRARYLWMLHDGRFLLRDRDSLFEGGATLELKPFLHFPGPLLWLELDPTQQFMVTNSREPIAVARNAGGAAGSASNSASPNGPDSAAPPQYVVRVLRRDSGQVMLVTRLRETIHLPIDSTGYVENLRGEASEWTLKFNDFTGGSRTVGSVESTCMPEDDFVSMRELLVTACSAAGGDRLVAMTTDGQSLWAYLTPETEVWPQLTMAPDGLRIARETLVTTHAVNVFTPLSFSDIKGQLVRIFDAATGAVALETPASPVLDVGGNVAISPSGRRVAVLDGEAIQVFELPPPPALPPGPSSPPEH